MCIKVTNSKEQLIWARDNEIDMESVTFSALRYGLSASHLWQMKNPNKYKLLHELSKDKKPVKNQNIEKLNIKLKLVYTKKLKHLMNRSA